MASRFDSTLSFTLTVAACVIAGVLARREFFPKAVARAPETSPPPIYQKGWETWLDDGVLIGNSNAPVKVVEFSDFECPYCKRFSDRWHNLKEQMGDSVALVYVHFPIKSHRFAMPAAIASECAKAQGRFAQFHDALFEKQDSLGLKSWDSFAREAIVDDLNAFRQCVSSQAPLVRIERNLARAKALGLRGTPSVMINGWLYPLIPADSAFTGAIRNSLRAKSELSR